MFVDLDFDLDSLHDARTLLNLQEPIHHVGFQKTGCLQFLDGFGAYRRRLLTLDHGAVQLRA
ncbi:hypothetical protein DDE05_40230 [Streptomyces cavourensis]|nr:hypothetical protein DDE05_40230 [Streptomyces cavourensis]